MDNLNKIKERLMIVTPNEELNNKIHTLILNPRDCFGIAFDEKLVECEGCTILAELDSRRERLNVFCKEILDKQDRKNDKGGESEKDGDSSKTTDTKGGNKEMNKELEVAKKETRPKMLARKVAEGMVLEQLLADTELLEKFSNHRTWIKKEFMKLQEKK